MSYLERKRPTGVDSEGAFGAKKREMVAWTFRADMQNVSAAI